MLTPREESIAREYENKDRICHLKMKKIKKLLLHEQLSLLREAFLLDTDRSRKGSK